MAVNYAHSGFALGAGARKPPPVSEISVRENIVAWLEYADKHAIDVLGAGVAKEWFAAELRAMSNAHGAPVQDAKAKYGEALAQHPAGAQPLRKPGEPDSPQQTVGEAIKQAFDAKAAVREAEDYNERIKNIPGAIPMKSAEEQNFRWYPDDHKERLERQYLEVVSAICDGKKDLRPMDKTEVAAMIDKARAESMNYTNNHVREMLSARLDGGSFEAKVAAAVIKYDESCDEESKPKHSRVPLYIAAYVLAGFGTFVHVQHYSIIPDRDFKNAVSIISTPLWPMYWAANGIYWTAQGALSLDTWANNALKPAPKAPAKSCTDDKSGSWAPDADGICHLPALPGAQ